VYINNVKQEEGSGKSYEASGTTITFSAAVASSDSCYLVYMGSAQQTVTAPAGSIVSSQLATAFPSASLDMNGTELILDADGDTSITADTDDRVDIKVAGSDVVHVDSGGRVGIGTNSPSSYDDEADNFVIYEAGSSGHAGITIANDGNDARGHILFADGTSGSQAYQGAVSYDHSDNKLYFRVGSSENLRLTNSVTGSGYTADSGTSLQSHPIMAIRASGQSRTDSYYDFTVDLNGGLYIICGFSHDQTPSTYGKFANFQVGHNSTYVTVNTLNAYGGNGSIGISKTSNTNLRVTFNKDESSGSGSYGTIEFVAVFGANPF
jgi:hypothetical protein